MLQVFKKLYNKAEIKITWADIIELTNYRWHNKEGVDIFGVQTAADVIVHYVKLDPGSKIPLMKHPNAYKKIIVTKGKALLNQSRILKIGDWEKIPIGYSHELKAVEQTELLITYFKKYKKPNGI